MVKCAKNVQRSAQNAIAEGANTSGIHKMARIGAKGKKPENSARDFMRLVRRLPLGDHIDPVVIDVLMKSGKKSFATCKFAIICPHDICAQIWTADSTRFADIFLGDSGQDGLREFWKKSQESDWYADHPFVESFEHEPQNCIPIKIHGDDGPMTKSNSLNVLQFSSVLGRTATMLSRWLIMVSIAGSLLGDGEIWDVVEWSLRAAASGHHPDKDWLGTPFAATSERGRKAGRPFAGGFKFILTWFVGDLKWVVELFAFEYHYNTNSICHQCRATKSVGPLYGYNYKSDAGWRFAKRLHFLYMQSVGASRPITQLPGVHVFGIQWDAMHILALGILQWALGAVFFELLSEEFWGHYEGRWQQRFGSQLKTAYQEFCDWSKRMYLDTSQRAFTVARLCLKSLQSEPYFKGKAYNTLVVAKWAGGLLRADAAANPADEHKQARATCLWGYCDVLDICREAGVFLSEEEAAQVRHAVDASLLAHQVLATEAIARGSRTWVSKPKHHYWQHIGLQAESLRVNPCSVWCFQDEDFIGRMVKLAKACHQSTLCTSVVQRYLLLMQAMLHSWCDENPFQEHSEHDSSDEAPEL